MNSKIASVGKILVGGYFYFWLLKFGKRKKHNIYAHSCEECEEKLSEMIEKVKEEIERIKEKEGFEK